MKRLVYHDQDPDGWMCAAILLKKFPDIDLYEVDKRGTPIDFKSGYDEVYVVDHSLWGEENLKKVQSMNTKLIWIDHHESAIKSFSTDYEGLRRIDHAACGLTWIYLYGDEPFPPAVLHVEEADIWQFKHPQTKNFTNFLETIPKGKEVVEYRKLLDKTDVNHEYHIGEQIEKYKQRLIDRIVALGVKRDFEGYKALVCDGYVLNSEALHQALVNHPDIQIGVMISTVEGKLKKYSLRSRNEESVDVSAIAKKHGGGGHIHAAGFISSEDL